MEATASTRERLIITAGELFAELGFDAVSTRMITDKAAVKLSSIHYHFGSKEALYIECCRYAHKKVKRKNFGDVIAENPHLMETPEGQARIVYLTVSQHMHELFSVHKDRWESKLLQLEVVFPTKAIKFLAEEAFRPEADASRNFYKRVRAGATDEEASAWSDLFYGQILLYKVAGPIIAFVRGESYLQDSYFQTVALTLSRAMILEAGLPLPDELAP